MIIKVAPWLYAVRRLLDAKAEVRGREEEDTRSVAVGTQGWEVNAITVESKLPGGVRLLMGRLGGLQMLGSPAQKGVRASETKVATAGRARGKEERKGEGAKMAEGGGEQEVT